MAHEFGHTLGLPDFYKWGSLSHIRGVMNDSHRDRHVTSGDEDYLEKMYIDHSPHQESGAP